MIFIITIIITISFVRKVRKGMPVISSVQSFGGVVTNSQGGVVNKETDQTVQVKGNFYRYQIPDYYDFRQNSSYVAYSANVSSTGAGTTATKRIYLKGLPWQSIPISSLPDTIFDVTASAGQTNAESSIFIYDKDTNDLSFYVSIPSGSYNETTNIHRITVNPSLLNTTTPLTKIISVKTAGSGSTNTFRFAKGGCYIPKCVYSSSPRSSRSSTTYYGGLIMIKDFLNSGTTADSPFFVVNFTRPGNNLPYTSNTYISGTSFSTGTASYNNGSDLVGYCAGGGVQYAGVEVIPRAITGWDNDFIIAVSSNTANLINTWTFEANNTFATNFESLWKNRVEYGVSSVQKIFRSLSNETAGISHNLTTGSPYFVRNQVVGIVYYPIGKEIYSGDIYTEYERILLVDSISPDAVVYKIDCIKNIGQGQSGRYDTRLTFTWLQEISLPGGGLVPTYLPSSALTNTLYAQNPIPSYALIKYNATDTNWYLRRQIDLFQPITTTPLYTFSNLPSGIKTIVQDTDLNTNIFYGIEKVSNNNFRIHKIILTKVNGIPELTTSSFYTFTTSDIDYNNLLYLPGSLWNIGPKYGGLLVSFDTRIIIFEFDRNKNIISQYDLGGTQNVQSGQTGLTATFFRGVAIAPKAITGFRDNLIFYYYNNSFPSGAIRNWYVLRRLDLDKKTMVTPTTSTDFFYNAVSGTNIIASPGSAMFFPIRVKYSNSDTGRTNNAIVLSSTLNINNYQEYLIDYNSSTNIYTIRDPTLSKQKFFISTTPSLTNPSWIYSSTNSLLTYTDLYPTILGTSPTYYGVTTTSSYWFYRESNTSTRVFLQENKSDVLPIKSFTNIPIVTNIIQDKDLDNNTFYGFSSSRILYLIKLPVQGGNIATPSQISTTLTGITVRGGCYIPICMWPQGSVTAFGSLVVTDDSQNLNILDFSNSTKTTVNTAYTVSVGYNAYAVEVIPAQASGFVFHFGIAFGQGSYSTWIVSPDLKIWTNRTTYTYSIGEGPTTSGNSIYYYPIGKSIYNGDPNTNVNRIIINDNDSDKLYVYKIEEATDIKNLIFTLLDYSSFSLPTTGGAPYNPSITTYNFFNLPPHYYTSSDNIFNYSWVNITGTYNYSPQLKKLENSRFFVNEFQWSQALQLPPYHNIVIDFDSDKNETWYFYTTGNEDTTLSYTLYNKAFTKGDTISPAKTFNYTLPSISHRPYFINYVPSCLYNDGTSGALITANEYNTNIGYNNIPRITIYEFNTNKTGFSNVYQVTINTSPVSSWPNQTLPAYAFTAEVIPKNSTGWDSDIVIASTYSLNTGYSGFYAFRVNFTAHNASGWTNIGKISGSPMATHTLVYFPAGKKVLSTDTITQTQNHRLVAFIGSSTNPVTSTNTISIYNLTYVNQTLSITLDRSVNFFYPIRWYINLSQNSYNWLSYDYYADTLYSGYWLKRAGTSSSSLLVASNSSGSSTFSTYTGLPANSITISQNKDRDSNIFYTVSSDLKVHQLILPFNSGTRSLTSSTIYTYNDPGSTTFYGSCYVPINMWSNRVSYGGILVGNNNNKVVVMEFDSNNSISNSNIYEISTNIGNNITAVDVIPMEGTGFTNPYVIGSGGGKLTYWIASFDTRVWKEIANISITPTNPDTITFYPRNMKITSSDTNTSLPRITINNPASNTLYVYTITQSGLNLLFTESTISLDSTEKSIYPLTKNTFYTLSRPPFYFSSSPYTINLNGVNNSGYLEQKLVSRIGTTGEVAQYRTISTTNSLIYDKDQDANIFYSLEFVSASTSCIFRTLRLIKPINIIGTPLSGTITLSNPVTLTGFPASVIGGYTYVSSIFYRSTVSNGAVILGSAADNIIRIYNFNSSKIIPTTPTYTLTRAGTGTGIQGIEVLHSTLSGFTSDYAIILPAYTTNATRTTMDLITYKINMDTGSSSGWTNATTTTITTISGNLPSNPAGILYLPPGKSFNLDTSDTNTTNRIAIFESRQSNNIYIYNVSESGNTLSITLNRRILGGTGATVSYLYNISQNAFNNFFYF